MTQTEVRSTCIEYLPLLSMFLNSFGNNLSSRSEIGRRKQWVTILILVSLIENSQSFSSSLKIGRDNLHKCSFSKNPIRPSGSMRMVLKEPSTSDSSTRTKPIHKLSESSPDKESYKLDQDSRMPTPRLARYDETAEKQKKVREASREKYNRKQIPESEKEIKTIKKQRQAAYDKMTRNTDGPVSLWSFESLFPAPVWDEESIRKDLYNSKERDLKQQTELKNGKKDNSLTSAITKAVETKNGQFLQFYQARMRSSWYGGSAMLRLGREPRLQSGLPIVSMSTDVNGEIVSSEIAAYEKLNEEMNLAGALYEPFTVTDTIVSNKNETSIAKENPLPSTNVTFKIDRDLTRMVEDRVFGYRRLQTGQLRYETSLMGDGAVTFRDGVRLGNPLRVNADRLNYLAKKEMQHGRVEEASEFYEKAVAVDPRDGRAYLGLSRCAERRRDFKLARKWLQAGVTNSVSLNGDEPDRGANPFLLQAMGCLEEKMGNLAAAESLYVLAAKSRPSHAAAWVSLAQIRTRKLGQPTSAGRVCFQTAERELVVAGLSPSSYVYTAWASLERNDGDVRTARKLFKKALEVDPKCSAAFLQLGVMEADAGNWEEAENCFTSVLKFDQRNSRVLQAYAIAETKRPNGNSRTAIELFERALKANPRDAGVLQAYALYVADLGDIKSARSLLRRGTEINKRHAPVWQAWGVLETRSGNFEEARKVFQEGIWACGQLTGSQSGGYECARLWQAWGVLEAQCKDYSAARRCFSRALDANGRNVPAVTAWAQMEEQLKRIKDARMIFERALKRFAAGSSDKITLWRSYELMEQRLGEVEAAKSVFQRSMRETMTLKDVNQDPVEDSKGSSTQKDAIPELNDVLYSMNQTNSRRNEFEVVRWESSGGEVWMNDRAIETKINMKNRRNKEK